MSLRSKRIESGLGCQTAQLVARVKLSPLEGGDLRPARGEDRLVVAMRAPPLCVRGQALAGVLALVRAASLIKAPGAVNNVFLVAKRQKSTAGPGATRLRR